MKIAITGAHGVGKTTLAKSLSKKMGLPMISEIARREAKLYGFSKTEQIRKAPKERIRGYQEAVYTSQVFSESALQKGFVSDRSVFDVVAYMEFYGLSPDDVGWVTDKARLHSKNYDLLIYCPIPKGGVVEDDGFRLTGQEGQEKIDELIKMLINSAECPVLVLKKERETWGEEIDEVIRFLRRGKKKCRSKLVRSAVLI